MAGGEAVSVFAGTAYCPRCEAEVPLSAQTYEEPSGCYRLDVSCARCGHVVSTEDVTGHVLDVLEQYGAAAFDSSIRPFGHISWN